MKKEFHDEKTGVLHDSDCPRTKKEFGEEGGGECPGEEFVNKIIAALPAPDLDSLRGREVTASIDEHGRVSLGPAKVNSRAFRDGHDRIFGTKPTVGEA